MRRISFGLVASILFIAPAGAETVERTVKANMRTSIGGFSLFNTGTCYAGEIVEGQIERQPANGTLELMIKDWKLPPEHRCPGAQVHGTVIVYTPKKGFKGTDEAVVSFPFSPSDGPAKGHYSYTYRIKVE